MAIPSQTANIFYEIEPSASADSTMLGDIGYHSDYSESFDMARNDPDNTGAILVHNDVSQSNNAVYFGYVNSNLGTTSVPDYKYAFQIHRAFFSFDVSNILNAQNAHIEIWSAIGQSSSPLDPTEQFLIVSGAFESNTFISSSDFNSFIDKSGDPNAFPSVSGSIKYSDFTGFPVAEKKYNIQLNDRAIDDIKSQNYINMIFMAKPDYNYSVSTPGEGTVVYRNSLKFYESGYIPKLIITGSTGETWAPGKIVIKPGYKLKLNNSKTYLKTKSNRQI
tara:strand:- start:202 stop:1032 length:831 start_codon:yes stop_codon:yes gene_type:complete